MVWKNIHTQGHYGPGQIKQGANDNSNMTNKSALKNQFCELTGTSTTTAGRYLDASKYNLEQAVDAYFEKHSSKSTNPKSNGKSATSTTSNTNKNLIAIFEKYKDANNPDVIDIDGTLKYLEDLKIDPEDPKSLTLAFLLKAPSVGVFEKNKFLTTWQHYNIHDIAKMSSFLNKFHDDVLHNKGIYNDIETDEVVDFKHLYDFAFGFLKESENQKVLDIDLAISYWKLLLPLITSVYLAKNESTTETDTANQVEERVQNWYDFLTTSNPRPVITFDTWSMFYLFFLEVILPDPRKLSNYDEMAAWPSKMDEYVEYLSDNSLI